MCVDIERIRFISYKQCQRFHHIQASPRLPHCVIVVEVRKYVASALLCSKTIIQVFCEYFVTQIYTPAI